MEKESSSSVKDAAMEKLVADVLDDETQSDELGFDIKSSEDEEKMEVRQHANLENETMAAKIASTICLNNRLMCQLFSDDLAKITPTLSLDCLHGMLRHLFAFFLTTTPIVAIWLQVNLDIDKFLEEMDEADKGMVGDLGLQTMDQVKSADQPVAPPPQEKEVRISP